MNLQEYHEKLGILLEKARKLRPNLSFKNLYEEILTWPQMPHEYVDPELYKPRFYTDVQILAKVERWVKFHDSHPSG